MKKTAPHILPSLLLWNPLDQSINISHEMHEIATMLHTKYCKPIFFLREYFGNFKQLLLLTQNFDHYFFQTCPFRVITLIFSKDFFGGKGRPSIELEISSALSPILMQTALGFFVQPSNWISAFRLSMCQILPLYLWKASLWWLWKTTALFGVFSQVYFLYQLAQILGNKSATV